jgi:hypothetical protein
MGVSMGLQLSLLASREYKLFISHAWEHDHHYAGVVRLLNAEIGFRWVDYSVPKSDPLENHPILSKSNRYLARQLDKLIEQVDCVLVIAGMYCKYRGWIQSEIEAALEFRKPIIAVSPYGAERTPSELNERTVTEWVGWRGASMTSAIRKHAPSLPLSFPLMPTSLPRTLTPPPLSASIKPSNLSHFDTSGMLSGLINEEPYPNLRYLLTGLDTSKKGGAI